MNDAQKYSHIKQIIFERPWAIDPPWLLIIAEVVTQASLEIASGKTVARSTRPSALTVRSGVPVIEVDGVISKKMNLFSDISGGTSIELLSEQFREGMSMDANALGFRFHSPGGAIDGIDEFAQEVFEARMTGNKTIFAIADNMCASAAAWIGLQADEFYVTSGGSVGSIGVMARFDSNERALKNVGIDTTIIRSGDLKAPGAGPLTPEQANSVMQQVQTYANMFYAAVTRARPQVNIDDVKRGQMFIGQDAFNVGLADGISTLDALVKRYAKN